MDFWQRYRAIDARDTGFDGQFYTAVRTTGIYCRPSCPARTPASHNVSFFSTAAGAQSAGYRACRRCRPDAAPGSPEWDVRADVVARAMRLIGDGEVERSGVPGLARRLGYSERQLHRLVVGEHVGERGEVGRLTHAGRPGDHDREHATSLSVHRVRPWTR